MKSLSELEYGEKAVVDKILNSSSIRRRFLDIGIIKDTIIKCVGVSPSGDPKAFLIRGAVIAIRKEDANGILVREV